MRVNAAYHHGFVKLVGELPAGGREQQEGQDEQRPNHQPGLLAGQPADLQLSVSGAIQSDVLKGK
jgi:hypothetical protein